MNIIDFYITIKGDMTYYVYIILDDGIKYKYITKSLWNKHYFMIDDNYYDENENEIYIYNDDDDGYYFF